MEPAIEVIKVVSLFLVFWYTPGTIVSTVNRDVVTNGHMLGQAISLTAFVYVQWII